MSDTLKHFSIIEFLQCYSIPDQAQTMFGSDLNTVTRLLNYGFDFDFETKTFNAKHMLNEHIEVLLSISRVNVETFKMNIQHIETKFIDSIHHTDIKYILFDYYHNYLKRTKLLSIIKIRELYKKLICDDKGIVNLACLPNKNNNLKKLGYGDLLSMDNENIFYQDIITPSEYEKLHKNRYNAYYTTKIEYNYYKLINDVYVANIPFQLILLTTEELTELNNLLEKIVTFTDKKNFKTFIKENQ